ncbi:MAG: hypothetical protein Q9218_002144 [Villophora microphyllina]
MSTTMVTTKARPRSLVIRNQVKSVVREVDTATPLVMASEATDPPLAASGDVQLINYYKPALEGGVYTININQQIQVPGGPNRPESTNSINTAPDNPGSQRFNVIAPRFNIDPNDVHSTYPPQGHADQPMILPHIVFNDPHAPWERSVSVANHFSDDDVMPWLAVIPFDINGPAVTQELRLTAEQLSGPGAIYTPSDGSALTPSTTLAVTMPLSQYLQLDVTSSSSGTRVRIPPFRQDLDWADMQNDSTPVQVIFLAGSLFNGLFRSRSDSTKLDLSQFRYCAVCLNSHKRPR